MPEIDLTSGADRNPIEVLAEEFVERRRRANVLRLSEYTRKYPELAEAIADLFPALLVDGTGQAGCRGNRPGSGPDASLSDRSRQARNEPPSAITGFSARVLRGGHGGRVRGRPGVAGPACRAQDPSGLRPVQLDPASAVPARSAALPGGCTMGILCRSTAWGSTRECTTMPCSSSLDTAWTRSSTTCGGFARLPDGKPATAHRRNRLRRRLLSRAVPWPLARSLVTGAFDEPRRTASKRRPPPSARALDRRRPSRIRGLRPAEKTGRHPFRALSR